MTAYYSNIVIENTILVAGNDVTQQLSDIATITYNTNDILFYNGTNIVSISPTSYKTTLGLNNVTNNLQVYNLGGARGFTLNTISNRPTASTNGNIFISTDNRIISYDNGTSWTNLLPAYTGDVTSSLGGTTLTLATVNSNIGTFNNVTLNDKGLATAASNVNYLIDPSSAGVLVRTTLNTTITRTNTGTTNQITVTNGDGVSGNPTYAIADNPIIPGTDSMTLPIGTTAQRGTHSNGKIRFNTTLLRDEISVSNQWRPLGRVLQILTGNIAQTTGTTTLPFDNTLPTSTEGFQIWSQTITPFYTNSNIAVIYSIYVSHNTLLTTRNIATVLYNDTTAISVNVGSGGQNIPVSLSITDSFTSNTISPITISARVGSNGGTISVNSTQTMGGITTSYLIIEYI